jgi:hypothetical protein
MHGTSLSSATLAVGLQSIDPLEAVMISTLSLRMSSLATSAVRLSSVLGDDLDLVGLTADLQTRRQDLTNAVECPILRFGEARHRTGLRGDVSDLDHEIVGTQNRGSKDRVRRKRRGAGLEHAAAARVDLQQRAPPCADERVFFHRYVLPLWQTIFGVRPADLCSLTGAIFRARMFRTLRPVDCFPRPPEQDFLQVAGVYGRNLASAASPVRSKA